MAKIQPELTEIAYCKNSNCIDLMKSWIKLKLRNVGFLIVRTILKIMTRDSNLVSYTRRELKSWFLEGKDSPNRWVAEHLELMMMLFSLEGHSGTSASYARNLFSQLSDYKPFGPLTGEDDEWMDCSYGGKPMWQNVRCSRVFKGEDGRAYDIEGKIFEDVNGDRYTSKKSRVYVKFPYTPKSIIVKETE